MVFDSFFSGRRSSRSEATSTQRVEPVVPAVDMAGQLAYPPVDPGIPVRSVDDILQAHDDLIRRIKLAYGADHETFTNDLMVVMRRYAQYVNLLPATPDNYFSGPGGLLRMGLEIAFYSLQATDGQIFSGRSTITNRRQLEPRWRHATFIAGLCCEIHRTLSHVLVTDDNGNEWPSYLVPLTDWLRERHVTRFFLRWTPNAQETRSLGVFALPQIIPSETLHHLAQGNAVVVPHMMASISGMPVYRDHNILDQLVRHAAALVIDRDLQASADRYGKPQLGSHLERYLVDALRRLVLANGGWTPNAEKSRVWYGRDGLYIVWPNAATEVIKLLDGDRLPGIPKAPETILEILIEAGIIEPRDATQATWLIYPPESKTPIEAVKLSSPTVLLAPLPAPPDPLPYGLLHPRETPAPAASNGTASAKKKAPGRQLSLPGTDPDEDGFIAAPPSPALNEPTPASDEDVQARPDHDESATANANIVTFSFTAPMRLNPAVRSALIDIVGTLNGEAELACRSVPAGLFVPLSELERRQIDTSIAVRALSDLSILVTHSPGNVKTVAYDFGGDQKLGIVIAPQYIRGFDPSDFSVPPPVSENSHASP